MTAAASRDADAVYMRRALALAARGLGQTAPNPMVGAVVVADGVVVGEGYHERYGDAHADVNALRVSGDRARRATVYVTLEPCAHTGKTPPCVDALVAAGVSRVVVAVSDPSKIARGGAAKLREHGVRVDVGPLRDEALELNAPFFNAHASDRPWVTLKLALSADGAIADPTGVHRWITGEESRKQTHTMRANADAIAVGVGTVITDDPALTVRGVSITPRIAPKRVVFDSGLRTPLDSTLVKTANQIETIIVERAPFVPSDTLFEITRAGVVIQRAATLEASMIGLRERGIRSLFVEGGAKLAGSLLSEGLVDRLVIFGSALRLGAGALQAFGSAPAGFEESLDGRPVVDQRRFGDDTMTIYALRDVPCSPD
ncbi:MAG: bifunctional diaminohydroxyphosphoribosylaminopyrimidine deaminase/5-amino-6-(5-phosphoribosylamino)uracil reductase RibD [Gemmatimonadaceae bacterium]